MTAQEVDAVARARGIIMTDSLLEAGLYYRLVNLYNSYDEKLIPEIGARKAKQDLIAEFEYQQRQRELYLADARQRAALSPIMAEANKNGCEICRQIARIYDGREVIRQ